MNDVDFTDVLASSILSVYFFLTGWDDYKVVIYLFMVHLSKFHWKQWQIWGNLVESECILSAIAVAFIFGVGMYFQGTFAHYALLVWTWGDAIRCILFLQGETKMTVGLTPYLPTLYSALMMFPLVWRITEMEQMEGWMVPYIVFISFGVTTLVEKQGIKPLSVPFWKSPSD